MIEYKIIEFEYKYIEDILDLWNSEVGFIFPISYAIEESLLIPI